MPLLQAFFEDSAARLHADPSCFDNEGDRLKFQRRYGLYATSISYSKE